MTGSIPTGKEDNARDWECLDCGTWYTSRVDAGDSDLPDLCIECGDTPGWVNVKTGRRVPDV